MLWGFSEEFDPTEYDDAFPTMANLDEVKDDNGNVIANDLLTYNYNDGNFSQPPRCLRFINYDNGVITKDTGSQDAYNIFKSQQYY